MSSKQNRIDELIDDYWEKYKMIFGDEISELVYDDVVCEEISDKPLERMVFNKENWNDCIKHYEKMTK